MKLGKLIWYLQRYSAIYFLLFLGYLGLIVFTDRLSFQFISESFTFKLSLSFFIVGFFLKRPSVIISSFPPIETSFSALLLSKVKGAKHYLDYRDAWPETFYRSPQINKRLICHITYKFISFLYIEIHRLLKVAPKHFFTLVAISVEYVVFLILFIDRP